MEKGNNPNRDQSAGRNSLSRVELNELVWRTGPLTIGELGPLENGAKIINSAEFQNLVNAVGWPNQHDDGAIIPPHEYTDETFRAALFMNGTDKFALNNFPLRLMAQKADLQETVTGTELQLHITSAIDIQGGMPYILRAYALVPELMQNLQKKVRRQAGNSDAWTHDVELIHDAHLAYRLLGRLMKADDLDTFLRLTGRNDIHIPLIDDAHEQLVT